MTRSKRAAFGCSVLALVLACGGGGVGLPGIPGDPYQRAFDGSQAGDCSPHFCAAPWAGGETYLPEPFFAEEPGEGEIFAVWYPNPYYTGESGEGGGGGASIEGEPQPPRGGEDLEGWWYTNECHPYAYMDLDRNPPHDLNHIRVGEPHKVLPFPDDLENPPGVDCTCDDRHYWRWANSNYEVTVPWWKPYAPVPALSSGSKIVLLLGLLVGGLLGLVGFPGIRRF